MTNIRRPKLIIKHNKSTSLKIKKVNYIQIINKKDLKHKPTLTVVKMINIRRPKIII